jgi:hypothetical protein
MEFRRLPKTAAEETFKTNAQIQVRIHSSVRVQVRECTAAEKSP